MVSGDGFENHPGCWWRTGLFLVRLFSLVRGGSHAFDAELAQVNQRLNRAQGGDIRWAIKALLVVVMLLPLARVQAQEPSSRATPQAEQAVTVPDGPAGRTTQHKTAADLARQEAAFSPLLQEYRERYRLGMAIRGEKKRRGHMLRLAKEVKDLLPAQDQAELLVWLKLLQDAYAAGGDFEPAVKALNRRFKKLKTVVSGDELAERAMSEALRATATRQPPIADALYSLAESLVCSQAVRFKVVMERGRAISERFGADAAASYYFKVVDEQMDEFPELAREAHYRAAVEYFHHGQWETAIALALEMEELYGDTEEAEKARHARKGWMTLLAEQRETKGKPEAASQPSGKP